MTKLSFIALDVETANSDYSSICSIGLAYFSNGELVDTWESLINPEVYFDYINVFIHGISEESVADAPKLKDFFPELASRLDGKTIAHHTAFDRSSLFKCANIYGRLIQDSQWIDTAVTARRTWQEVSKRGYGLENLSHYLGIELTNHHNALADAILAGKILLKAADFHNDPENSWLNSIINPFGPTVRIRSSSQNYNRVSEKQFIELSHKEADPNGFLFGEVVVFTGALSLPRLEAASLAYSAGCDIDTGVTKRTTILVVGDQDTRFLAGYEKSSKHRKAEELIRSGQNIKILNGEDFFSLISQQ